ncbi:hypothetical protein [Acidaminococcus fermentans]|uniref:hypothetical protein n=1 Tax=Acidaminococcus fermentans TaxID=905 RepID=UPI0009456145|nr:hypothetical protein [Acidaminococcus fermentans]
MENFMMTVGATRSCRSEFHVKEEAGSQFFKFFYGTLFPMEAFFDKMKERHIYSPFSSSWWLR